MSNQPPQQRRIKCFFDAVVQSSPAFEVLEIHVLTLERKNFGCPEPLQHGKRRFGAIYAAGRGYGGLLNKASSGFKRQKRYYKDHDQGKKHKRVMLFSAARFENFVSA